MSLIPSESYGFPDHFTRTVTPSPKLKNEELEAAPLETRMKPARPAHRPRMMPPPESPVSQNPVAERVVAVSNLQADSFEKFAQSDETPLSKRRRKAKMRRFRSIQRGKIDIASAGLRFRGIYAMTIDDYEAGGHASVHGTSRRDGIER